MPTPSEEILVRVTAQLSELEAGMQQAVSVVQSANAEMVGEGKSADEAMAASAKETSTAISTAHEEAAASVTAANATMAESADAAALRIKAMVKASLEQAGANRITAESERSLAERQGIRATVTAEEKAALDSLTAAQERQMGLIGGTIPLEELETEAAHANAAAKLEQAAATNAFNMSSRASAEVGTMASEALAGNFGRIRRSAAALANQTGVLSKVMRAVVSPVGLVVSALAALGAVAIGQQNNIEGLNEAIRQSGNVAGVTSGDLEEWSTKLGENVGTIGHAEDAYRTLAASGRFVGDALQKAGEAAMDMSVVVGMSSEDASNAIIKMAENPTMAIMRLNSRLHFLTAAQRDQVQALLDMGNTAGATDLAIDDLRHHMHKAAMEAKDDIPWYDKLGEAIANAYHKAAQGLDVAMGGGTIQQKIKHLQHMRDTTPYGNARASYQAQIDSLQKQLSDARAKSQRALIESSWIDPSGYGQDMLKMDEDRLHRTEAMQQMSYDERIKYEQNFWSHMLQTATKGSAEYIAAYEHLQGFGKKSPAMPRPHAAHADSSLTATGADKKEAAAYIGNLDAKRAATLAFSAERIRIDRQIVDNALALYGEDTSQYRRAVMQKEQDERVMNQNMTQLDLGALRASASHAQAKIAMDRDALQQKLAMRQITASQEIAQEEVLQQQLYKIQLHELQAELKLMAKKPLEVQRINAQIEALQDGHERRMQHLQDRAQKENIKRWERFLQPVSQAINGSVQGIIQGTQTAGQAIRNFERNMLATFIKTEMDKLIHYTAIQLGILTVKQSTDQARTASHVAAAATAKAIDAKTGKSQITSAAATGAAKAYQAIVGIPYVGPILAPIAAGVAFAGIEAFSGMISSARGGWERVPFDGAMTELHKDEMVLPAHVANPIRDMARRGGSGDMGGGVTVNLSSTDPRGFKDYLRRNPSALSDAIKHASRRGHFAGAMR